MKKSRIFLIIMLFLLFAGTGYAQSADYKSDKNQQSADFQSVDLISSADYAQSVTSSSITDTSSSTENAPAKSKQKSDFNFCVLPQASIYTGSLEYLFHACHFECLSIELGAECLFTHKEELWTHGPYLLLGFGTDFNHFNYRFSGGYSIKGSVGFGCGLQSGFGIELPTGHDCICFFETAITLYILNIKFIKDFSIDPNYGRSYKIYIGLSTGFFPVFIANLFPL
jgi:hypothetical protein